mmetsp:Transcript_134097/g.334682  ORF Transcript_134097/g.334682 Transcript_134097/m.334682 type:complete len:215 (-) Transcript_134097:225-869(-)
MEPTLRATAGPERIVPEPIGERIDALPGGGVGDVPGGRMAKESCGDAGESSDPSDDATLTPDACVGAATGGEIGCTGIITAGGKFWWELSGDCGPGPRRTPEATGVAEAEADDASCWPKAAAWYDACGDEPLDPIAEPYFGYGCAIRLVDASWNDIASGDEPLDPIAEPYCGYDGGGRAPLLPLATLPTLSVGIAVGDVGAGGVPWLGKDWFNG